MKSTHSFGGTSELVRRSLTLLAATGLGSLGTAQSVDRPIDLDPPLPNYKSNTFGNPGGSPTEAALNQYGLTAGDLNGDDVPDLVFNNGVAFCRVYFLKEDPSTPTGLAVDGHWDIHDYGNWPTAAPTCATTGQDARFLSISRGGFDQSVVYDIDLDGVNELIYLEHADDPGGRGDVHLQVWEFDPNNLPGEFDMIAQNHGIPSPVQDMGQGDYFAASCGLRKDGETIQMRIVNVRGRAMPQDILVWTNFAPSTRAVRVYRYDSDVGGSPLLMELFTHQTEDEDAFPNWGVTAWEGNPGHNWRAKDIDLDGMEELLGVHIVDFDTVTMLPKVKWGMVFDKIDVEDDPTLNVVDDNHPDSVQGVDFMSTYLADDGDPTREIPAPGMEVLVAAQKSGDPHPDPSGPWLYRALLGHSLEPDPPAPGIPTLTPREWPIRLLNVAQTSDGESYQYASNNMTGWVQPDSMLSLWDAFAAAIQPPGPPESETIGSQTVLPANLVADSEGLELLVETKFNLEGIQDPCDGDDLKKAYYMFDSSPQLRILDWGTDVESDRFPEFRETFLIDFLGERDQIELASLTHTDCPQVDKFGNPVPPPAHAVFSWGGNCSAPRTYCPEDVYFIERVLGPGTDLLLNQATTAADMRGDSREELLMTRLLNQGNPNLFPNSEVVLAWDATPANRPEPSPFEFVDYRRRSTRGFDPMDYDSLNGLRFVQSHLPVGEVGVSYGFEQDPVFTNGLPGGATHCAVLVAEGGDPGTIGYSIQSLTPVSALPDGLSLSKPLGLPEAYDGALCILGTPLEEGTFPIKVQVTDSVGNQHTQVFWLTIEPSGGGVPGNGPNPFVRSVTFGAPFLAANTPTTLQVTALVQDADGDVDRVEVFGETGGALLSLTQVTATRWCGNLVVPAMAAGTATHFRVRATDDEEHVSPMWPYMEIRGGDGVAPADFVAVDTTGQSASVTPTISHVQFTPNDIPAAEVSKETGQQSMTVFVGDTHGLPVERIELVVGHGLIDDEQRYSRSVKPTAPMASSYSLVFDTAAFPPIGQFGWGSYPVNVRITVKDPVTGAEHESDWWPQLVAH